MGCRRRIHFTDSRKAEIWDRRQRGESMRSIGRGFDRNSSSIFPLLPRTCAIRQLARARSRPALAHCDREEISGGLGAQRSFRAIASATPSAVDDQPRGGAQWRPRGVSRGEETCDQCRLWGLERGACQAVESRVAKACRRDRAHAPDPPLSARHIEVEQD